MNVIPQVRMFFKAEGRANLFDMLRRIKTSARQTYNLFDMLRRIKTSARQTYTRYGTGSVVSRSLSMSKCGNPRGDCSLRFAKLQAAFRTDRLTSNVPYAVRFVLRNDSKE